MSIQLKSQALRDLRLHRGLVLRFLQLNNDVAQLYQVVEHLRRVLENCEDELAELIPLADYRMREAIHEVQRIIKSHFDYLKRNFLLHALNLDEKKKAEEHFLKHLRKKLHQLRIYLWHLQLLDRNEFKLDQAEKECERETEEHTLHPEEKEEEIRETRQLTRRLLRTRPEEIRQMAQTLQAEIQNQYERFIGEFHELTREASEVHELTSRIHEIIDQRLLALKHTLGAEYQHIQHVLSEFYHLTQHASLRIDEVRHFMHHLLRQIEEKYQELLQLTIQEDELFHERLEYIQHQKEGQHHLHPTFYHPVSHLTYLTTIEQRLREQHLSLDEQKNQVLTPSFQHIQTGNNDKSE